MQCSHCGKWVQSSSFTVHLEQCGENGMSLREKTLTDYNSRENIHISVSQSVAQETEGGKKPYFEYIIQVITDDKKWKTRKQYRQFTELSQVYFTLILEPPLKIPFNQIPRFFQSVGQLKEYFRK